MLKRKMFGIGSSGKVFDPPNRFGFVGIIKCRDWKLRSHGRLLNNGKKLLALPLDPQHGFVVSGRLHERFFVTAIH
jgi:hypothetical protein